LPPRALMVMLLTLAAANVWVKPSTLYWALLTWWREMVSLPVVPWMARVPSAWSVAVMPARGVRSSRGSRGGRYDGGRGEEGSMAFLRVRSNRDVHSVLWRRQEKI